MLAFKYLNLQPYFIRDYEESKKTIQYFIDFSFFIGP